MAAGSTERTSGYFEDQTPSESKKPSFPFRNWFYHFWRTPLSQPLLDQTTIERAPNFSGPGPNDEALIAIFDPQKDHLTIEAWVSRVDDVAKTYNWSSKVVARIVPNRLRGMARRWYDNQQHLNVEWRKLKLVLVKQFRKPLPFAHLLLDAATYEAMPGQDLIIPELYLIDAVIGGIPDENIARSARSSNFEDTNELYAFLSQTKISQEPRNIFLEPIQLSPPEVELLHGILLVSTVKVPTLLVSVLGRVEGALIVNVWAISKQKPSSSHEINEVSTKTTTSKNPYLMQATINGRKSKALGASALWYNSVKLRLEPVPNIIIETVGSELESNNGPADTLYAATICEDMRTIKQEIEEIKTNFNALKEEIKQNYSKINVSLDKIFRILSSQEPMHKEQAVAPPKEDLLANIQFPLGSCEELIETETIIRNNVEFRDPINQVVDQSWGL
ncbi:hypothetical protein GEV33_005626 [Tenebrio molitor]|uniref:Retrotransposon gag domain-containing protein n=1 Tax=Tenebrio molitor TaxID=7067 RepID=A0A8J6HE62_TENMO|nr:hypothetical protein GEV33_005626 [Tenebrio molitor]